MEIPLTDPTQEAVCCSICWADLPATQRGDEEVCAHYTPKGVVCCAMHVACMRQWFNGKTTVAPKCPSCMVPLNTFTYHNFFDKEKRVTLGITVAPTTSLVGDRILGLQFFCTWVITDERRINVILVLVLLIEIPIVIFVSLWVGSFFPPSLSFFVGCQSGTLLFLLLNLCHRLIIREVWITPSGDIQDVVLS